MRSVPSAFTRSWSSGRVDYSCRFATGSRTSSPKSLYARLTRSNAGLVFDGSCRCVSLGGIVKKTTGDCFGPFPLIRPVPFGWLYCGTERLQEFSRRGRLRSWLLAWAVARVHLALCVRRFALQRQGHHLRGAQRRRLVQFRLSPRCRDDMGRRRSLCSTTLTPHL